MRKTFGGLALFLMLCGLLMTGFAAFFVLRTPDLLEYTAPADIEPQKADQSEDPEAQKTATALSKMLDALDEQVSEIEKAASKHTLWGFAAKASISELTQDTGGPVGLKALGQGYTFVYPMLPLSGRLFYEDELKYGDRVVLLDEQLALKLFQVSDPIEREVTVDGQKYTVVGVVRHQKAVGDAAEMCLYIPLSALKNRGGQQLDQVVFAALPEQGAGTFKAMEDIGKLWRPMGTLHDTRREKQAALLAPRWVSGIIALYILIFLARRIAKQGRRWRETFQGRLKETYMVRLVPWVSIRAVSLILMVLALAGGAYLLCVYMVEPVLMFPEWVPAIPVEIDEILKTFWSLQWSSNAPLELRTEAILRLRHFRTLANTGTLSILLAGLFMLAGRLTRKGVS